MARDALAHVAANGAVASGVGVDGGDGVVVVGGDDRAVAATGLVVVDGDDVAVDDDGPDDVDDGHDGVAAVDGPVPLRRSLPARTLRTYLVGRAVANDADAIANGVLSADVADVVLMFPVDCWATLLSPRLRLSVLSMRPTTKTTMPNVHRMLHRRQRCSHGSYPTLASPCDKFARRAYRRYRRQVDRPLHRPSACDCYLCCSYC